MFSENLYRDDPVMSSSIKSGFVLEIPMNLIRNFPYVFRCRKSNFSNFRVTIKIDKGAITGNIFSEDPELFYIVFKSRKNVHMVPRNPVKYSNIRHVKMEFRSFIKG